MKILWTFRLVVRFNFLPVAAVILLAAASFLTGCTAGRYASSTGKSKETTQVVPGYIQTTLATYYDDKFDGRTTTSGEVFRQDKMSAAHTSFPMGTKIKVTNRKNGRRIELTINDRMPSNNKGRDLDLSKAAARALDMITVGIVQVEVEVLYVPEY